MLKGLILAVISAFCYATLPILAKAGYDSGMTAVQMLAYRFCFGALILAAVYLVFNRKALIPKPKLILKCAGLGIGLYMLQSMFFISAVKYIPASTTALILYIYPLIVLVQSTVFLKVKFRPASLVSAVLIICGCCLVFYDAFLRNLNMTGLLLAIGAPFTFATYLTMSQVVLKNERPASVALYILVFAGLGFALLNNGLNLGDATANQMAVAIALGVIPSAIAVSLLFAAMELTGATYVSLFSSVEPAATLFLASVFLGETIVAYQVIGVALLILGIVAPNLKVIMSKN
jgi:drug/metabolite transporter (DMT)-like permease